VILRQPLIQTRRQQKRLLTVAPQEVLRHDRIAVSPPDDPPLYATAFMESDSPPLGTRFPLEGDNITARVFRSRRSARIDHYADATGAIADTSKARACVREPACRSSSTGGPGA
jgi:hypothetical protein